MTAGKAPSTTGSSALDEVRRRARSGSPARPGLPCQGRRVRSCAFSGARRQRPGPGASPPPAARAVHAPPALARPRPRRGRCTLLAIAMVAQSAASCSTLCHHPGETMARAGVWDRARGAGCLHVGSSWELAFVLPSFLACQTRSRLCHSPCYVNGRAGDRPGLGADRAPAHRPAHRRARRAPGALEVAEVRPGAAR